MKSKKLSILGARELLKDKIGLGTHKISETHIHLKAAASWLLRAQAVGCDRGVSRMYSLVKGWGPSYPETTGYIIPTLMEYGKLVNESSYIKHALEMADWEVDIQMECGGVIAGTVDAEPAVPTIFNTGQNLFGWIAAYQETGNRKYLEAANKAAQWMIEAQEKNGSWIKFASPFCKQHLNTYNIRSAWGICEVYAQTGDEKLLGAVERNIGWVLLQQNDQGWFDKNCLSDNSQPLTHTIGYTIEGILGIGIILDKRRYVEAAQKAAERLVAIQRDDGSLPGRLDSSWKSSVNWVCLTGLAQISICWWLLFSKTGEDGYRKAAIKANDYLKSKQDIHHRNPGIRGGIKGSFPVNGPYGRYQYLNWAAKFFMDSLMLEIKYAS